MTDKDQYTSYRKDGFCIYKGLLQKNQLSAILGDINHLARLRLLGLNQEPSADDTVFSNLKKLFDLDHDAYMGVARLAPKLLSVKTLALDTRIQDVVWMLQQTPVTSDFGLPVLTKPTEAIVHFMSRQLVIPGGYSGFKPHQDWTSIQGSLDSMVVWMPLTTITEESFPLQVIPGSHLNGLLGIEEGQYETRSTEYDEGSFVSALIEPGDVAFMSSWTVHRTGVSPGTQDRLAISTRYENAAEPTFVGRNYPGAYRRTVIRDMITPNFPSKEQVIETFNE